MIGATMHARRKDGLLKKLKALVIDPNVNMWVTKTRLNGTKRRIMLCGFVRIQFEGDTCTYVYPREDLIIKGGKK